MPLSFIGTALISPATFCGDSDDRDVPEAMAASCSRPMPTGESCAALRSQFDNDCFAFGAESRAVSALMSRSGLKAMWSVACPEARTTSRKSAESA